MVDELEETNFFACVIELLEEGLSILATMEC